MIVDIEFPAITYPEGRLFAPRTKLVDRVCPDVEQILLRPAITDPGHLQFKFTVEEVEEGPYITSHGLKQKLKQLTRASHPYQVNKQNVFIDLRVRTPENWAHAFTNHLPLALLAREKWLLESAEKSQFVVILPLKISKNILSLFELSKFTVIQTDDSVVGRQCQFELQPWTAIRGERVNIVARCLQPEWFTDLITREHCLGDHLFLARKDTRKVINNAEVGGELSKLGYKEVYLEDYPMHVQISSLIFARRIVAVHGAGLGPLILRKAFNSEPLALIELFSPAHITNVYRIMNLQCGGRWVGVRGRLWADLLLSGANFSSNLQDFEVCLDSLKEAVVFLEGAG